MYTHVQLNGKRDSTALQSATQEAHDALDAYVRFSKMTKKSKIKGVALSFPKCSQIMPDQKKHTVVISMFGDEFSNCQKW